MLYQDFLTNQKRLIHKVTHYFPVYERYFNKFVNQSVIFWEIGVFQGGSLQMWKRYLGPFATIVGIDINPDCKNFEEHQIHVRIGNQTDTTFLRSVIDEFGAPDIILDDGSHIMSDVCATFQYMYDKVSKNGVYIVEDLHTAYWDEYGGGLKREGSFIELCKDLMDSINARHNGLPRAFADATFSMSVYDSVVAFEKKEWREETYHVQMTPSTVFAQLFFYIDEQYGEERSLTETVLVKDNQYKVAFDVLGYAGSGGKLPMMKEIRFDPAAEPITFTITESKVIYSNGGSQHLKITFSNAEMSESGRYTFHHNDPILIFDSSEVDFTSVEHICFSGIIETLN
ncbi:hypothetical protein AGMMS49957_18040 [Synergistales bacterium]|nr:hypothetical protein AGMMS49957_18040 [Synergistales bacterium]